MYTHWLNQLMLRYSLGPSREPIGSLSAEDRVVRRAFGCAPEDRYRVEGEKIVLSHQKRGHWFLCDCRDKAKRPPTLFLTVDGFIQREDHPGDGTPHADDCVFARNDRDQTELVGTHQRRPKNEHQFDLVKAFREEDKEPVCSTSISSSYDRRDTLATVLYELLHAARLDRLFSTEILRGDTNTQKQEMRDKANSLIMEAAQSFSLTQGQPMSEWISTNLHDYNALKKRLEQKPAGWKRPHGLFIDVFYTIKDNGLYLKSGALFAKVTGKLSVFGEKEAILRPPYLVIGLLAHPARDASKVECIRAYAHPCISWERLMLVDSKLERQTLDLLVDCRDWLRRKHHVTFSIEKPMFDLNPDKADGAREICRPDFVLRNHNKDAEHPIIVIETMGYETADYREGKKRLRPLFEKIGHVIEHDHFLANRTLEEADDKFFRTVCAVVLGRAR